jgi:hypothetical protein
MSVHDVQPARSRQPVPRPRTAASDDAVEALPADEARETEASPEPWRPTVGTRPSTEYWDVATASWRSRGRLPRPATGD